MTKAELAEPTTGSSPTEIGVPRSEFRKLLVLAWPLILSNSFTTLQITIDRLFLSQLGPDAVSGATSAVMLFWTPFVLFHCVASYGTTFVAQYTGAGRPSRVGPAVWQALWFSLFAGLLSLLAIPFAGNIVAVAAHSPELQKIEATYFECLIWMALPALIVASVSGFFSGRGDSRTIIWINALGLLVNAVLDYVMIFGKWGCPALGVAGAGWATVIAMWASALLGLGLMMRKRFRAEFATLSGWKPEFLLFKRLRRYGLPSGFQWVLDMTAFTAFVLLMGWFGNAQLASTSLAITINNLAFIPMLGIGQAVSILVGQRLGENRADLAEKSTYSGFIVAGVYMGAIGGLYLLIPSIFVEPFRGDESTETWALIAEQTRLILIFVAFYSIFDSINIVFSFALRGAGDTLFVTYVALFLAWPVMVLPSWWAWREGWSFYWAWGFASVYIAVQALCFILRFRHGKWKSMRVIEPAPPDVEAIASDDSGIK
ncbi:MAG: MATE family efflux transporter [Planctomycetes bacterium]|nr:MATE family efflux transporter [Planctomycetota bacterium]